MLVHARVCEPCVMSTPMLSHSFPASKRVQRHGWSVGQRAQAGTLLSHPDLTLLSFHIIVMHTLTL